MTNYERWTVGCPPRGLPNYLRWTVENFYGVELTALRINRAKDEVVQLLVYCFTFLLALSFLDLITIMCLDMPRMIFSAHLLSQLFHFVSPTNEGTLIVPKQISYLPSFQFISLKLSSIHLYILELLLIIIKKLLINNSCTHKIEMKLSYQFFTMSVSFFHLVIVITLSFIFLTCETILIVFALFASCDNYFLVDITFQLGPLSLL